MGYEFRSSSDTEVLLNAYRQWGHDCLQRLNGMWAFLIYDRERSEVFGSRDRFGVKPLYRHRRADTHLFCSEIKGFLASGLYKGGINWEVAANYLYRGDLDTTSETFFAGIEQIPAGTAFVIDRDGSYRQWRYWHIGDTLVDCSDAVQCFQDLFEDAVRLRLRSDVPVGVCLSGGLDSTSIACAMSRINGNVGSDRLPPMHAFSYCDPKFDETRYIEDTLQWTRATLNRFTPSGAGVWARLEDVLLYHDEPVHSTAAFVGFDLFAMAARRGVKVVLNGQGSDETLAGYPSYFRNRHFSLLRYARFPTFWLESQGFCQTFGLSHPHYIAGILITLAKAAASELPGYRHLARARARRALLQDRWFAPDLAESADVPRDREPPTLDGALHHSVVVSPLPLYLRIEDRNSMAHSVEARLPFMDYRLVSLAFQLADDWKIRGDVTKYVLRKAMCDRIPPSVRERSDKMGFPNSTAEWFRGDLARQLTEILDRPASRDRGIYNLDTILNDLKLHVEGRIDISGRLFRVAQFEAWCRRFHDEPKTARVAPRAHAG